MNILVIGSGGREHTLAWKLSQSPKAAKLYAIPGNPGMAEVAECVEGISITDNDAVADFAKEKQIDLAVVGPEVPLTNGLVDALNAEAEGLDFDLAFPGYLNAMPAGWNKGRGIQVLCEALGCTTDEVVVFGDADNDLAMFDVVENSVAVSDATSNAAAAAKWHIGACADDAVAEAIEKLAEGVWPFTA